jgi:hypothetical protein
MADYVFVVRCHHCDNLIKIADDPTGGQEQWAVDLDQPEDLTCPSCHREDTYQASELRRVQAGRKH